MGYLIPIIVLFLLLWLFVIRPQRRRQLQQLEMQNEVHLGDDVITVEIAPDVRVRLDRRAVAAIVRPEDEETEEEPENQPERVSSIEAGDG